MKPSVFQRGVPADDISRKRQVIFIHINDAALRFLSSRNRTAAELERYLKKKEFAADEIQNLIEEFKSYGYLDDSRYCCEYFHYAFSRGKGKRRVVMELREKGVEPQVIQLALEEYEPEMSERARARNEAEKILRAAEIGSQEPVSEKLLGRVARRLQSKGYSSDIIYSIIGELRR